ncbi:hypothetical protein [Flavobacterium sp. U410]|jgi:hypothetical protein
MEIKLQHGLDRLVFGMTQKYVETLYGKPNRTIKDDEDNIIYVYNDEKMKLTFYADEDFRLGYITSTNPDLQLFNSKIINTDWDIVQGNLAIQKIVKFDQHEEDGVQIYFNEDNWLMLYVDYNEVVKVEIGAIINNKDEFDWKFNV